MDTRQLAVLVAVVDRSSFSVAADQLGVTQPAVSLAIQALEKRLGARLLDRSGRTVRPTEAGRTAYRHAQRVLAAEGDMLRALDDEDGAVGGPLVVGASSGPGERLLPVLLGAFRAEHPEVQVSLRVDDSGSIVELVADRQVELGVVGAERPQRSLLFEPFLRDEILLCLPPGHPAAGRTLSLEELRALPLVVQQEGSGVRAFVERELRLLGVRPRDLNVLAELGLTESTKAAVEGGLGACFASAVSVERELGDGRLVTASVRGLRTARLLYTVRLVNRPASRVLRAFLAFAADRLGERSPVSGEASAGLVRGGRVG